MKWVKGPKKHGGQLKMLTTYSKYHIQQEFSSFWQQKMYAYAKVNKAEAPTVSTPVFDTKTYT